MIWRQDNLVCIATQKKEKEEKKWKINTENSYCIIVGLNESKSSDTENERQPKSKSTHKERRAFEAEKKCNCIKLCRAAAALFIFKLTKMIEESARKRHLVEYIVSLKCGAAERAREKSTRAEDHIDDAIEGKNERNKRKKRATRQNGRKMDIHCSAFFGSQSLDGLW